MLYVGLRYGLKLRRQPLAQLFGLGVYTANMLGLRPLLWGLPLLSAAWHAG